MSATASARPIEFRNTTLGATLAVIQAAEPSTLADAMHKMLGGMPDFFNGEGVILDFGAVVQAPERIDWAGLQSLLRRTKTPEAAARDFTNLADQTLKVKPVF